MYAIDINCDLGETPGNQPNQIDEALLDLVSSANIACGFHAGDAMRMEITIAAALKRGVAIGAHPGLDDKANFGRIPHPISPREAYQLVLYQMGALSGFVQVAGGKMQHVKLHGALYNMVAQDRLLSEAVVQAIVDFNPALKLYALAGSTTVDVAKEHGLRVVQEGFADRRYESDGTLVSRQDPMALITDRIEAVQQSILMVKKQGVQSIDKIWVSRDIETICIHGDGEHALSFAQDLTTHLLKENIFISAPIV
ncbi:LamB/YcsF family protein [Sphingobacterium sp. lm-10]|uniref:5-oxoprolinase subunit PxpA n=1 Tax=Sphingobacterium sp. lm-10 TaxID=2944904 RepID=UPI0020213473|nr:5-oxoprolinase subunit PxpA [Sphingobacterium sp. lm-10]MCL7987531.1 LamB/YcsF family protein [Sphingobacterium sp. lm-10]